MTHLHDLLSRHRSEVASAVQGCIREFAVEHGVELKDTDERALRLLADDAVARVTAAYGRRRDDEQGSTRTGSDFVAHGLRNPLSSAVMALGLLRESSEAQEREHLMELLGRNLGRLQGLIEAELQRSRSAADASPEGSSEQATGR